MNDFLEPASQTDPFTLLDAQTTAVLCVDAQFRIRYINSAGEQLVGLGSAKVLGDRLPRAIGLPDALFGRLSEALETDQPYTDRQVTLSPHGLEPVQVDCHISPFRADGAAQSLLLELAIVDRPLRIVRDEAMLAQQEHARILIRGLAHEIRNPLGGLRGAAQLLERQLVNDELRDYTSVIIREADRLQQLIDRLLGPVNRPRPEAVNLHEVLEHVRTIMDVAADDQVVIRVDYDPSIPECFCDRGRLVQVFLNIVNNARQAIGEAGTILFRTRVQSNMTIGGQRHSLVAAVEIQDDGPGVPDVLLDQIFYPLVTGTDNGSGLGLSIAQSIMHQIGGLIECRSEPGKTVFTVLIPMQLSEVATSHE